MGQAPRDAPAGRAAGARINLLTYAGDLPRFGDREAYLWREGVRWRSRSYAELHRRIQACAARLAAAGVRRGDPVLLQGPDGADWVEALFGILAAGGVAVPLDDGTPGDFRERVARTVGATHLVAPPGIVPPAGLPRIDLGSWGDATALPAGFTPIAGPATSPAGTAPPGGPALPSGDDRAEIIFTSGTTGDPKGVVLTHGNLVSDFAPIERGFRRHERRVRRLGRLRFLSTLPLSHMFGQALSIFLPLAMGLTVVFVPPRPREVVEAARRFRAWGLFTVPRLLDLLAAEVRRQAARRGPIERFDARRARLRGRPFYRQAIAFPGVQRMFGWRFRLFVAGGAPLPEALQQFWESLGYLVVQGYGLTETAPIVAVSNPFERRPGSVGAPLGGQEVRLGPGGEILVRGPNVTPGYFGAGQEAGDGWFRTGDIGEFDERGRLRIRGRLKDVIVTPEGENVHPADVEAAFAGVPGLREAAVIGLPVEGGDRVHAVLLVDPGADPEGAVRRANERLLPKQRVRGWSIWPDEDLPRTPTGKVRKIAVRERLIAGEAGAGPSPGTRPPAAAGVRGLVAQIARVPLDRLEDATPLVAGLGLASLDLVELAVAVEEEFGVGLPEDRLAAVTVGDLERLVTAATAGSPSSGAPAPGAARPGAPGAAAGPAPPGGGPPLPRWARRAPVRFARRLLEELLFRPFIHLFARPEVRGLEHLRASDPPFLFVANHHGYVDSGLFKTLLPRPLRGRIAPAMTTRYHRLFFGEAPGPRLRYLKEWLQVRLVEFLFHAWPLPETAGVRQSLSYAGELADAGYSLLVFPEGRHVPEGRIETFRKGIGLFARELRMPIIPAYVEGASVVFPDHALWPRFGRTRLVIGAPLHIDPAIDAAEATRRIEAAVRALQPDAPI